MFGQTKVPMHLVPEIHLPDLKAKGWEPTDG